MSQLGFVEVAPASVPTPPAGAKTIFVDNTTHVVSVKDESGTISPLGGASGLTVGGVLTGTLPNPGLASTAVVGGAYGDASHIVTLTVGNDGRLTAATTVAVAIAESNITLSDVTTDNVSITKHGFAPKAPNDVTKFLDGTGAFSVPSGGAPGGSAGGDLTGTYPNPTLRDSGALTVIGRTANSSGHPADITASTNGQVLVRHSSTVVFDVLAESEIGFTDITTNNRSTSKHGYGQKLPNDSTKFEDGTGSFRVLTELDVGASTHDAGNTSTALTIDWSVATQQKCTATGNATITHSNMVSGKVYTLEYYTGAGSFTATFASTNWPGGTAPTLTVTASKVDVFTFDKLISGTILGAIFGQSFAP